ncbi:MAG: M56 family metallopeptidase [Clostridia bacterium]|nr:M56 family metallopeptidase [Clostridia bacterium]
MIWTAFFALLTIPLFDVFSLIDLELFINFTGGMRVEIQNAVNGDVLIRDLYLPKSFLDAALTVCAVLVYGRLAASAGHFTYVFSGYLNNLHFLTKYSEECHDDKIKRIYERAGKKSGLKRKPSLRVMRKDIRLSPCTCGIVFPSVYIGKEILYDYTEEKLELVFLHELTHIKHGDSFLKLLTLIVTSVFSFVPGARLLAKAVSDDAEFRCDSDVIAIAGKEAAGEYMSVIIDIAERNLRNDYSGYDFLSPASRAGELILERYREMKKGTDEKKNFLRILPVLVAALFMNMIMMSSVSVINIADPGVDFADPLIEKAVCGYFDIGNPTEIRKSTVDSVYSIEYLVSDYSPAVSETENSGYTYAAVIINEGLIYNGEEYVSPSEERADIKLSCDLVEKAVRTDRFENILPKSNTWKELLGEKYAPADGCFIMTECENDHLLQYLLDAHESGEFDAHRVSGRIIDTRDTALFGGLRTLIFSDYLKASNDSVYSSKKFAVINRD